MKLPTSFDFWKLNANEGLCFEILNLPTYNIHEYVLFAHGVGVQCWMYYTRINLGYTSFIPGYWIYSFDLFYACTSLLWMIGSQRNQDIKIIWTAYQYVFDVLKSILIIYTYIFKIQLNFTSLIFFCTQCLFFVIFSPPTLLLEAEHGRDFGVWDLGVAPYRHPKNPAIWIVTRSLNQKWLWNLVVLNYTKWIQWFLVLRHTSTCSFVFVCFFIVSLLAHVFVNCSHRCRPSPLSLW